MLIISISVIEVPDAMESVGSGSDKMLGNLSTVNVWTFQF